VGAAIVIRPINIAAQAMVAEFIEGALFIEGERWLDGEARFIEGELQSVGAGVRMLPVVDAVLPIVVVDADGKTQLDAFR
jgi:hypothetical protein